MDMDTVEVLAPTITDMALTEDEDVNADESVNHGSIGRGSVLTANGANSGIVVDEGSTRHKKNNVNGKRFCCIR